MVDSEYSPGNCKSLKISLGAIIKNLQMLSSVPDHLKTKRMCENSSEKSIFLINIRPKKCVIKLL